MWLKLQPIGWMELQKLVAVLSSFQVSDDVCVQLLHFAKECEGMRFDVEIWLFVED